MTALHRLGLALAAATAFLAVGPGDAWAQEPRLAGRLADPFRAQVEVILDSAAVARLPTEALVDRALEGAAMGASGERIVQAVRRLLGELELSRNALGAQSTPEEIVSGASALRAGAAPEQLARLRELRGDRSLMVAASVLADLVAVGVPTDTAVAAVLALAVMVDDAEYVAFRRNVERDIALGASPVAALGVGLAAEGFAAADAPRTLSTPGTESGSAPPKKP
jgi:hypothetical protein